MSIPSLLVMLLKMTLVNIIVIFMKKNEIQIIGSTTVQIVVILLIQNVFWKNTQILSLEVLIHLTATYTHLLLLRKLKTTLHVTNVAILVKCLSTNVLHVISTYANFVYRKDKCD